MGWWRPYFFVDSTGVQLLLPTLALDGSAASLIFCVMFVAPLAILDRWLERATCDKRAVSSSHESDGSVALLWTAQRATGTLLMLLFMSFNVPVVVVTLCCLGASERLMLWRERLRGKRVPDEIV